ncbi:pantoate/beta-alanine ligase [Nitritalea halalkaliphila LW7]|uniref:Pantothenate synthetase n=1 Tax=Nitritalea halalkaliphila LW7 TaxID=1189621 RepID=I5C5T0_9BACT|nr:pantoate--beta-alanine ligase [Nitritalea halalkaliphila]EIM77182.1 pantoate/beta-alanine ligase [Nitritalea halalkaliphila LW7]
MKVLRTRKEALHYVSILKKEGKTIGFVPTMGALHDGHLSLVQHAIKSSDHTIASIFINPLQFNNQKDFENYPKDFENDLLLLKNAGTHAVYLPDVQDIYPEKTEMRMHFGPLDQIMEGATRPGHFSGVGIILSKLFHTLQPDRVIMGQKDLQQCAIVDRLIRDLGFPIALDIAPTVREKDGLAMSSRNRRLTSEQRTQASTLYQALSTVAAALKKGENWATAQKTAWEKLETTPGLKVVYLEWVDLPDLQPTRTLGSAEKQALCIAAFLGEIRLIDNLIINN